jgi:hypothetical protein
LIPHHRDKVVKQKANPPGLPTAPVNQYWNLSRLGASLNLGTPLVDLQGFLALNLDPKMLDRDVVSAVPRLAEIALDHKTQVVSQYLGHLALTCSALVASSATVHPAPKSLLSLFSVELYRGFSDSITSSSMMLVRDLR